MCISIPPKLSGLSVIGYIKGKSAISIARNIMGRKRNFGGENFWARGFFVSTIGLNQEGVKIYIREQELKEERLDQLQLDFNSPSGGHLTFNLPQGSLIQGVLVKSIHMTDIVLEDTDGVLVIKTDKLGETGEIEGN